MKHLKNTTHFRKDAKDKKEKQSQKKGNFTDKANEDVN